VEIMRRNASLIYIINLTYFVASLYIDGSISKNADFEVLPIASYNILPSTSAYRVPLR
jgi:hypothetical protein